MKKLFFAFIFLFISSCNTLKLDYEYLSALDKDFKKSFNTEQKNNWHNLDIKIDSIPGMSVERAYSELLYGKIGKKVIVAVIDAGIDINHEDIKDLIWVNDNEIHYSDDQTAKSNHFNKEFELSAGIHDLEILHEEPTSHSMRFYARLQKLNGEHWMLTGKSLQGSVPKVIRSGQQAKVIRKWIKDLPPRTLLLLLPNKVMLAYDSSTGKIIKGWQDAIVDQTPSLDSRSQKQSEVKGKELVGVEQGVELAERGEGSGQL